MHNYAGDELDELRAENKRLKQASLPEQDRALLMQASFALLDARRLWPTRHPASGLIMGIEGDCRHTYERITAVLEAIQSRLARPDIEAPPAP